jgi:hypothetical protein
LREAQRTIEDSNGQIKIEEGKLEELQQQQEVEEAKLDEISESLKGL